MALVALLVVGGGALAVTSLGGDDDPPTEPNRPEVAGPGTDATAAPEATPDVTAQRGETVVTVLNGTAITGLAAEVAQQLTQAGYPEGQTDNFTGAQRAESVVLYRGESQAQARDVGEVLEISDVRPIDRETRSQKIGDAEVVVIAGHDQAP